MRGWRWRIGNEMASRGVVMNMPVRSVAIGTVPSVLALCIVAGVVPASGSDQRRGTAPLLPVGTSELRGRVLEFQDGAPVPGARVVLVGYAAGAGGRGAAYSPMYAASGSNGSFEFVGLPAGEYALTASAPGYSSGSYLAVRPEAQVELFPLAAGEKKSDLDIRLRRYGSISGLVRDSDGTPAAGVRITLFQSRYQAGRVQLSARRETSITDDRGLFKVEDLPAGVYLAAVVVTGVSRFVRTSNAPMGFGRLDSPGRWMLQPSRFAIAGQNGTSRAYRTTFFPNVTEASSAQQIKLAAGESRTGIDFQMRATTAFEVAGTLTSQSGPMSGVELRLMLRDAVSFSTDVGIEAAITQTDDQGRFMFLGVTPGNYSLRGVSSPRPGESGDTLWTDSVVSVPEGDLRGLSRTMHRGGKISGRIRFVTEGSTPAPSALSAIAIVPLPLDPTSITRMALPRVAADGTFASSGLPDGQYFVDVNAPVSGWALQSITAGKIDLLREPITITGGNDWPDVAIAFSDRTSSISGTVTTGLGPLAPNADVVVIPADDEGWRKGLFPPRRCRRIPATSTGTFLLDDIPAGTYWLIAVKGLTSEGWQSPSILQSVLPDATRVTVRSGDKASVRLKVVSFDPGK